MGRTAVVGVERIQEGAQHTALWGAGVQCGSGGEMRAESYSLGTVCKKVLYPSTCERREAKSYQFGDEDVRDDCNKG